MPAARLRLPLPLVLLAVAAPAAWVMILDARTRQLAFNTLLLSGSACAISLAVGTCLALLVCRTDLPGRALAAAAVCGGLFVPPLVYAGAWQAVFGRGGWLVAGLHLKPLAGWYAAIGAHALAAIPWVFAIVAAALVYVDSRYEESALLEASPLHVLLRVTLARVRGALAAAAIVVMLQVAGDMSVTNIFMIRTYAEEVYSQLVQGGEPGEATWRLAPAVGAQALLWCLAGLAAWRMSPRTAFGVQRSSLVVSTASWRPLLTPLMWSLVIVAVFVPWGSLAYQAGVLWTREELGIARHWSLLKCLQMVFGSLWRDQRELINTIKIGGAAAGMAIAVAVATAAVGRRGGVRSLPALATAALAWAAPGPLVGIAIITLLNQPHFPPLVYLYDHTILAPALAQAVRAVPAAILILLYGFASVPQAWLDTARLEGLGPTARLIQVMLRTRWRALAAASVAAFALACNDLAATILVIPPGPATAPIALFNLLHAGVDDRAAAMSLAFSLAAALLAWTVVRLLRPSASPLAGSG